MKKLFTASIVICLIIGCNTNKRVFFEDEKEDMRVLHNQFRADKGLAPLTSNEMLENAAQKHADWMARYNTMSHYEGRKTPWQRAEEEGYNYKRIGENIAVFDTPKSTFNAWTHSRGHLQNILGNYSEFGVGMTESQNGHKYWVVIFGLPPASIYSLRR